MSSPEVKLRHKVQLRKKADAAAAGRSEGAAEYPAAEGRGSKNRIRLPIAIAVVGLGLLGLWLFSKPGGTPDEVVSVAETIGAAEPSEHTDEAAVPAPAPADEETATPDEAAAPAAAAPGPETAEADATTAATLTAAAVVSNDVEAEAMKVIRGIYGDGQERKDKLGSRYRSIQDRVNELKREGVF